MFNILIVDDESLIRYCLTATFRDPSFAVQTAANGREAMNALEQNSFDLCILDLHLPDMNGMDILKSIRSMKPSTKVIVISGDTLSRESRTFVEENAVLYLDKPFDLDQVRATVNMIRREKQNSTASQTADAERRRHARTISNAIVRYSAITPRGETTAIDLTGTLRDISDTGMQLFTHLQLQPGWWLIVSNGNTMHQGIVRWSTPGLEYGSFRAGVQFSGPVD